MAVHVMPAPPERFVFDASAYGFDGLLSLPSLASISLRDAVRLRDAGGDDAQAFLEGIVDAECPGLLDALPASAWAWLVGEWTKASGVSAGE